MFKEFFYFPKSDRKAILVALTVAVMAVVGIWLVGKGNDATEGGEPVGEGDVNVDVATGQGAEGYAVEGREVRLAPFDPNLADSTQLLSLGLQPWQVKNILKYRAKGGVFRQPTDFARVYGLTVKQYRELEPYIRISTDFRPAADVYGNQSHRQSYPSRGDYAQRGGSSSGYTPWEHSSNDATPSHTRDTLMYPVKLKAGEHIDLNRADTTALKKVPGIGSYYARKVVAYRENLGGFCSTNQLLEIEGFPQEATGFFVLKPSDVRKLNVNHLTLAQLRKHPYINFYMAKAIVDRVRLKGPLHSLDELSLLPDFTPEVINKLAPYVEF